MTHQRQKVACSWIAGCLFAAALILASSVHETMAQEVGGGSSGDEDSPFGTKYTEWVERVNYTSSTHFQVRGMEPFYNVTNMILKWFEPEPTIPDGKSIATFLILSMFVFVDWRKKSRPMVRICLHNNNTVIG